MVKANKLVKHAQVMAKGNSGEALRILEKHRVEVLSAPCTTWQLEQIDEAIKKLKKIANHYKER